MARTGATTYKAEILEQLRKKLRELPEHKPEGLSKTEIVRSLPSEIDELQKRGYSMRAIAEIMSTEGVPITTVTLKGYLGRLKLSARRSKRRRRRSDEPGALMTNGPGPADGGVGDHQKGAGDPRLVADTGVREEAVGTGVGLVGAGKKKALETRPIAGAAGGSTSTETHQMAGVEVDKRKSTFVPRDDSRDI